MRFWDKLLHVLGWRSTRNGIFYASLQSLPYASDQEFRKVAQLNFSFAYALALKRYLRELSDEGNLAMLSPESRAALRDIEIIFHPERKEFIRV